MKAGSTTGGEWCAYSDWRRERNWDPTFSEFVGLNFLSERNWLRTGPLKSKDNWGSRAHDGD
jgi:hypothetical protein